MATASEVDSLTKQMNRSLETVRSQLSQKRNEADALKDEERRIRDALKAVGASSATAAAPSPAPAASRPAAKKTPTRRRRPHRSLPAPGVREAELMTLLEKGEYTQADLSDKMGVSKVRIQQLLAPLRQAGKVSSRPDPNSGPRKRMLWTAKKSAAASAAKPHRKAKKTAAKKPRAKAAK